MTAAKHLVCDFCSEAPVIARYQAKDFVTTIKVEDIELTQVSLGDWAACKECEVLVDTSRWDAVVDRATAKFYEHHPYFVGTLPVPSVREALWDAYAHLITIGYTKVPFYD
jgi:hypothetical protein